MRTKAHEAFRRSTTSAQLRTGINAIRRPGFNPSEAAIVSLEAKRGTRRALELAQAIEQYQRTLQNKQ